MASSKYSQYKNTKSFWEHAGKTEVKCGLRENGPERKRKIERGRERVGCWNSIMNECMLRLHNIINIITSLILFR